MPPGRSSSSAPSARCPMADGSYDPLASPTPAAPRLVEVARTATLATIDGHGRPRLVPMCYVIDDAGMVWSALDEKPKHVADTHSLARVRDLVARPEVGILVDRWSEDWSRLAW